ncbi:TBC1 domain family member 24 [Platysternon megacephalum]|uniref:TBC1 domain family member 24 n=1 Tax=Platysternon megacephalum TaxID=55544 RepID=A0A4D9EEV6_9SAUR|nr:TBC1 domain family member 24 [Platysternon megacephalum]
MSAAWLCGPSAHQGLGWLELAWNPCPLPLGAGNATLEETAWHRLQAEGMCWNTQAHPEIEFRSRKQAQGEAWGHGHNNRAPYERISHPPKGRRRPNPELRD